MWLILQAESCGAMSHLPSPASANCTAMSSITKCAARHLTHDTLFHTDVILPVPRDRFTSKRHTYSTLLTSWLIHEVFYFDLEIGFVRDPVILHNSITSCVSIFSQTFCRINSACEHACAFALTMLTTIGKGCSQPLSRIPFPFRLRHHT